MKRRIKQIWIVLSLLMMTTLPSFAASVNFLDSPTEKFQKYALGAAFFIAIVVLCIDGFILLTDKERGKERVKKAISGEVIGLGIIVFVPQLILLAKDVFGV